MYETTRMKISKYFLIGTILIVALATFGYFDRVKSITPSINKVYAVERSMEPPVLDVGD